LLRSDARLGYVAPTAASLRGIELAPVDVDQAERSLAQVVEVLRAHGDPRAVFPDVYGVITRNVGAEIHKRRSAFQEPAWLSRLAGYFAERYLAALGSSLRGERPASKAWAIAFAEGDHGHTAPVLDALLGINAHINFDLAQGLVDNVRAAGAAADPRRLERYKHDHDHVNLVLRASMPEIFERLELGYGCVVTRRVSRLGPRGPVTDFMLGILQRWREDVWGDMSVLLRADEGEGEATRQLQRMNDRSAQIAWRMLRRRAAAETAAAA
jgi:hypothetical protein